MNNKQNFLNKYFVITVILIIAGGVYYFKFYRGDNPITVEDKSSEGILSEDSKQEVSGESKTPAPVPKVTPKAPSAPTSQSSSAPSILLKNNFVSIKNNTFNPSVIVIKRGTEITWENGDNAAHQIASDSRNVENPLTELGSKILAKGQSYTFMFTKPGTFDYYCRLHPFMKATVMVTEQ